MICRSESGRNFCGRRNVAAEREALWRIVGNWIITQNSLFARTARNLSESRYSAKSDGNGVRSAIIAINLRTIHVAEVYFESLARFRSDRRTHARFRRSHAPAERFSATRPTAYRARNIMDIPSDG
jgi:hypothetical protein